MDEQFIRSYSTLELQPGSSWDELRFAYRSLVKKWHPDRFRLEGERRRAEEKTKEITRAYKTLADYYRKHGHTPVETDLARAEAARPSPDQAPDNQAVVETENADSPADNNAYSRDPNTVKHTVRLKPLAAVIAAALLLYLWQLDAPPDSGSSADASPENQAIDIQPAPIGSVMPQPAGQFFTHGTKIGDVYSIQGLPSKTENGIWHYGKSRVIFIDGAVSHWQIHPDNPLKASLGIEPTPHTKKYFTRGSTKAEVTALHGTPWRQTEYEWVYGPSRIFFSDGMVTGWQESPLHPLKTGK